MDRHKPTSGALLVSKASFAALIGTIIAFRLGVTDAEILQKEVYLEVWIRDLIRLPNYYIYLKLMINGMISAPFNAQTIIF